MRGARFRHVCGSVLGIWVIIVGVTPIGVSTGVWIASKCGFLKSSDFATLFEESAKSTKSSSLFYFFEEGALLFSEDC